MHLLRMRPRPLTAPKSCFSGNRNEYSSDQSFTNRSTDWTRSSWARARWSRRESNQALNSSSAFIEEKADERSPDQTFPFSQEVCDPQPPVPVPCSSSEG